MPGGFLQITRQQLLYLQAPNGVGDHVPRIHGDPSDRGIRGLWGKAALTSVKVRSLTEAPFPGGQFRVHDRAGAAHPFPARRVQPRIQIAAVEPKAHKHFLAVESPTFLKNTAILDLADKVRM